MVPHPALDAGRANRPVRALGIAFLVASQSADALTTALGLLTIPGVVERNPLLRAAAAHLGVVPAVVAASVVVVAVVVLVVETGAAVLARLRPGEVWPRLAVRSLGYGIPTLVTATVAIHNAALILRA